MKVSEINNLMSTGSPPSFSHFSQVSGQSTYPEGEYSLRLVCLYIHFTHRTERTLKHKDEVFGSVSHIM